MKLSKVGAIIESTRYYLDGATIIAEDRNGTLIHYYYDSTGVIGMSYNGTYYYYVKDFFGNVIEVRNMNGNVVAKYEYDAWGNCEINANVGGMANINPFRYRGYYMDTETGYYYLQTRYYDPGIRRFISSDSYGLIPTLAQAGDLNLYAYCSNNPVMYTDPSGQIALSTILIGFGASMVYRGERLKYWAIKYLAVYLQWLMVLQRYTQGWDFSLLGQ